MRAEENKTYAQILNGVIHWVFTINELPEWNEVQLNIVDVTGQDVSVGDVVVDGEIQKPIVIKKIAPISPRQIRLALLALGVTESDVDAQVNSMPSPEREQAYIAWKFSTQYNRDIPLVELIGTALGLDSGALDDLWLSASAI